MRVLIADAHPTTRLGIKSLLLMTDARVVGEAGDAGEALRLVEETMPDLVIMDLNLEGEADGAEFCRRVKSVGSGPPRVLIHASGESAEELSFCLLAGADGYLPKHAASEELLDAIRRMVAGERVWELDGRVGAGTKSGSRPGSGRGARLTSKEREVAGLVLRRYSNARIAEELYLSMPTVKTHLRSILSKLGLKSRWEIFHLRLS